MSDKIRKLTEEEEQQAKGTCYKEAYLYLIAYKGEDAVLVHGNVILPHRGIEASHAWVEIGNKVFDPTFGPNNLIDKNKFYNEIKRTELKKYLLMEALANLFKSHHYGPWD